MAKIDYDLVFMRSEDARMSLKELARHLRTSPQRLKYSLAVLEKEKIIAYPYCIFDYSSFGLVAFRVYFKGGYIGQNDKEKILSTLLDNPYVISLYELTGEFDLVVEFASPNPSNFNKELKKIISAAPTLNNYKIITNLATYIYPRPYLTKNSALQSLFVESIVGEGKEKENFNQNELAVIKNLLLNPVIRAKELSSKTNLNIKTVKSITKNLIKRNVIKGFRYPVDTNKLGIGSCRLFLKLHNLSIERESHLMAFMAVTPEIVRLNKTMGDWDLELDIESPDKARTRQIILQIREKFKDLIEWFNMIEFYSYYKKSYLPIFLFKEENK